MTEYPVGMAEWDKWLFDPPPVGEKVTFRAIDDAAKRYHQWSSQAHMRAAFEAMKPIGRDTGGVVRSRAASTTAVKILLQTGDRRLAELVEASRWSDVWEERQEKVDHPRWGKNP